MYKQTKMSSQIMPNVFCPSYQNLSSEKKNHSTGKNDKGYNYTFLFKHRFHV